MIFLAVLPVVFSPSCNSDRERRAEETIRPAKIQEVKPIRDFPLLSFPGKVRASRRVDLSFKVSGPLIELSIREGQRVKQDGVLARIDPRDFVTNLDKIKSGISEAQARLKAMEAGARPEDLKMLASKVAAARALFQETDLQYKRYTTLYQQHDISKSEYDRLKAAWEVAGAQLNTAIQDLEKGKKGARKEDIDAMRAQIQGLRAQEDAIRNALTDTCLRAPFSGIIAKKFVENYQEVVAKQPIVSLQNIERIEILIHVSEIFMIQAKRDCVSAFAEFAAAPGKQYPLTLKEFSTEADPATQTYRTVLEMPAPKGINILPGMTATVRGTSACRETLEEPLAESSVATFLIPISAVFTEDGEKTCVWVVDPDTLRVKRRQVKTGGISGPDIHIFEGLVAGDKIVTAGVNYLQDGQKIKEIHGKIGD